jgi:hypothetical protein
MAETISEINKNNKQLFQHKREEVDKHFFDLNKSFYFPKMFSNK